MADTTITTSSHMIDKLKDEYDELKQAFLDALEGNYQPHDIQYFTGLSDERCKEISDLYERLTNQ